MIDTPDEAQFTPSYRVRIRFFTSTFVQGKEGDTPLRVAPFVGEITAPAEYVRGETAEIRINVRGIGEAEAAKKLGTSLRRAISVMAALRRLGVDLGEDVPTASLAHAVRTLMEAEGPRNIRNNMHGVDVFFEERPTSYFGIVAHGYVSMPASRFGAELEQVLPWISDVPLKLVQVANLLNATDYTPAEEAKIALAMSAIEAMAPDVAWSDKQRQPLADLQRRLCEDSKLEPELSAVAATLNGVLGGPGIGTQLRQLLNDLNLSGRWPDLRELRQLRGKLMHGEIVSKSVRIDAATRTRSLAAEVFAASLRQLGLPDNATPPSDVPPG